MAIPDQDPDLGDQPSPRQRLSRPQKRKIPFNRAWFEPSDLTPFDAPDTKPKSQDYDDLPPPKEIDTIRDDIQEHYQDYEGLDTVTAEDLVKDSFDHLSQEDKLKKLLQYRDYLNQREQAQLKRDRYRYEQLKDKKLFDLKLFIGYSLTFMVIVAIVIFLGIFAYVVVRDGVLTDSGVLTGLFNTFAEVVRIITSSNEL